MFKILLLASGALCVCVSISAYKLIKNLNNKINNMNDTITNFIKYNNNLPDNIKNKNRTLLNNYKYELSNINSYILSNYKNKLDNMLNNMSNIQNENKILVNNYKTQLDKVFNDILNDSVKGMNKYKQSLENKFKIFLGNLEDKVPNSGILINYKIENNGHVQYFKCKKIILETDTPHELLKTIYENPIKFLNGFLNTKCKLQIVNIKIIGNNINDLLLNKIAIHLGLDTSNLNNINELSTLIENHIKYNPINLNVGYDETKSHFKSLQ